MQSTEKRNDLRKQPPESNELLPEKTRSEMVFCAGAWNHSEWNHVEMFFPQSWNHSEWKDSEWKDIEWKDSEWKDSEWKDSETLLA
jgi:hypothetical protein